MDTVHPTWVSELFCGGFTPNSPVWRTSIIINKYLGNPLCFVLCSTLVPCLKVPMSDYQAKKRENFNKNSLLTDWITLTFVYVYSQTYSISYFPINAKKKNFHHTFP